MTELEPREGEDDPYRVVLFPDSDVLRQRLIDAGLYGNDSQADRFYDAYIGYLNERELKGYDISHSWDLANYETESIEGELSLDPSHPNYVQTIAVLIDDSEIAAQALKIRLQMFTG
jgi:hypothetical protein